MQTLFNRGDVRLYTMIQSRGKAKSQNVLGSIRTLKFDLPELSEKELYTKGEQHWRELHRTQYEYYGQYPDETPTAQAQAISYLRDKAGYHEVIIQLGLQHKVSFEQESQEHRQLFEQLHQYIAQKYPALEEECFSQMRERFNSLGKAPEPSPQEEVQRGADIKA